MAAGARGSRRFDNAEDDGDVGVDAFTEEELARRPEVRIINTYAVFRAYVLMGLKGIGALVLLWATVVLLGGFVSSLKKKDFWYISFISFVQAGGMFNAIGDKQLKHLVTWMTSAMVTLHRSRVKRNHVNTQPQMTSCVKLVWSWLKRRIRSMISKLIALIVFVILYLVLSFCAFGPIICAGLSVWRLRQPDYGRTDNDDSHANMKPGMDLFYFLCVVQGIIFVFIVTPVEILGTTLLVRIVSRQVGLSREVVLKYCVTTKLKYFNNLASSDESWNFITYSAGLLDSEMPEDNAWGARVLTTLIDQGVPVRRLLVRSPGQRMQKLIRTLVWRSPAEGEMRWLAARIIEHVAHDLSLAEFPGALQCISSLLSTSGYNYNKDGDREATIFLSEQRHDKQHGKQHSINSESILVKRIKQFIRRYRASTNDGTQDRKELSINSAKGTNEDLILQGLRILENLALDEHNCRVICSDVALFSKIVSPVSSNNLVQDMKKNPPWIKVTDESLKLVSRLMSSTDDAGKEMRCRIATNSSAVKNLEDILALEISSTNIIVLKIRSIEILEQICWVESTSSNEARERRENMIIKVQNIFLTDQWMEDYLSKKRAKLDDEILSQCNSKKSKKSQQAKKALVENKMNEAQETLSKLKEKAGDTLTTLCMENQINYEYIRSFTGCGDVVHYLTEMLDSKERTIRCRFSAAVILKHLCTQCTLDPSYIKDTTLNKVLRELLNLYSEEQPANARKAIPWCCSILYGRDDIENQRDTGHDEHRPVQSHKKQHEQRMLQVALLSLCAAIRRRWINAHDFASVVAQLVTPEDLVEKLKKIVEENRYATVSCLATVKLTCEFVIALIPHDHRVKEVKMKKEIVDSLCQAAETMAGLESCMLFAGSDHDCYGLPVQPFCSDLVKQAQELLRQKEQEMGLPSV
ncbi:unnamed protein product [Urochloa humidicola]